MKLSVTAWLVLCISLSAYVAPSQTKLWLRQTSTPGSFDEQAWSAAVDTSGNIYVAGTTVGTFPGQVSAGSSDGFLAKYDSSGNLVWVRQFGSTGFESPRDVAVDATGIYVTGYTTAGLLGEAAFGELADSPLAETEQRNLG